MNTEKNRLYLLGQEKEINRFHNTAGEWANAGGDDVMYGATAAQQTAVQGSVQTIDRAKPIIITLTNSTATGNVSFLGAAFGVTDTSNYGVTTGVTATYGLPGWTYAQFITQLMSVSYYVKELYMACDTASQLRVAFTVTYYDLSGRSFADPYSPTISPMNNQDYVNIVPVDFILNSTTKITLTSLTTANSLTINFYSDRSFDPTRGLIGRAPVKNYSGPGILMPQPVQAV
jgi:hypothetical protein